MAGRTDHSICQSTPTCTMRGDSYETLANDATVLAHRFFYYAADNKWYAMSNGRTSSHQYAKDQCAALGMRLGSIKSQNQQNFIEMLANENFIVYDTNYRIGSERRDLNDCNSYIVNGLAKTLNGDGKTIVMSHGKTLIVESQIIPTVTKIVIRSAVDLLAWV